MNLLPPLSLYSLISAALLRTFSASAAFTAQAHCLRKLPGARCYHALEPLFSRPSFAARHEGEAAWSLPVVAHSLSVIASAPSVALIVREIKTSYGSYRTKTANSASIFRIICKKMQPRLSRRRNDRCLRLFFHHKDSKTQRTWRGVAATKKLTKGRRLAVRIYRIAATGIYKKGRSGNLGPYGEAIAKALRTLAPVRDGLRRTVAPSVCFEAGLILPGDNDNIQRICR